MRPYTSPAGLLRGARAAAGVTQAELARRLGTTQAAVSRLEARDANPTVKTLARALAGTGHRLELGVAPHPPSVDETLVASRLRMTPAQRVTAFEATYADARAIAAAGRRARGAVA